MFCVCVSFHGCHCVDWRDSLNFRPTILIFVIFFFRIYFHYRDSKNERQRAKRQSFSDLADFFPLADGGGDDFGARVDGPTLVLRSNGSLRPMNAPWEIVRFATLKELKKNLNWFISKFIYLSNFYFYWTLGFIIGAFYFLGAA